MAAGEGMKSSWSNHCPCGRVSLLEHIAEGRVATAVNLALRIIIGLRAVTAGRDLPFWAHREGGSSPLVPGQAEPILCSVCGGVAFCRDSAVLGLQEAVRLAGEACPGRSLEGWWPLSQGPSWTAA